MIEQPTNIEQAVKLGKQIYALEQAKKQVEDEMRFGKNMLANIERMLTQLWLQEGQLRRR